MNKFKEIEERTNLAGNNKLELLIFQLKNKKNEKLQSFAINVFKVREVMLTPDITPVPHQAHGVVGIVSLRGKICTVIDLTGYLKLDDEIKTRKMLVVTEYNNTLQGFLIDDIKNIVRKNLEDIKSPPQLVSNGYVTAVTKIEDDIISVLDVESILININPEAIQDKFDSVKKIK